jgi:membrane-associated phospholipid phosphatase
VSEGRSPAHLMKPTIHLGGMRAGVKEVIIGDRPSLLTASGRRLAGALLACCVVFTGVAGALFAHQATPDWLDRAVDAPLIDWFGGNARVLVWLAYPATLLPAGGTSAVAAIGCLIRRRLDGAVLAALAIPVASAINDSVLKPLVHRTYLGNLSYPSGHTASMFALAAMITVLAFMPGRPYVRRRPGMLGRLGAVRAAVLVAAWALGCVVAVAVIGLRWHYFTDAVAGAAVGTGTVCGLALVLDRAGTLRRSRGGGAPRRRLSRCRPSARRRACPRASSCGAERACARA